MTSITPMDEATTSHLPRVLLLSCSERKKPGPGPAVEIYDGPAFRLLRRCWTPPSETLVWIVSAKHGLISSETIVEAYDQRLTRAKASEMSATVSKELTKLLDGIMPRELCVCMPRLYRELIDSALASTLVPVKTLSGGRGIRLQALRSWLTGQVSIPKARNLRAGLFGPFVGLQTAFTQSQLIDAKNTATANTDRSGSLQPRWHVHVSGYWLPAKKFASAITGVPSSQFETRQALSFLMECGYLVEEVPRC